MIIPALADIQREKERRRLTASQLAFTCAMFESVHKMKFSIGAPQEIICDTLDAVMSGDIKRLIINVPPGYSKTEIAVINFMARGIAADPSCRFIHATYSQTLALDNSSKVRDVINCELFKELWNVEMKADTSAKGLWRTTKGGGVRAASSGEPITGFRAGHIIEDGKPWKFTGALIIDDPLKPDDAHSDTTRKFINARWHNTFKSRLASEDVPVIVIMQRLHTDDFVAHLLETSGEKWHVLKLPILIDGECGPIHENAIMIPHNLPNGPLWDKKHTLEKIEVLKLSPHVFAGQYMQEPVTEGGNLFKVENLQEYDELPPLQWRALYVDTAQKTGERNDYSVIQHWGRTRDGRAYLIDQMRAKFEAPELEAAALAMWMKARAYDIGKYGSLRKMAIEDKVSGTGLIQTLKRKAIPIVAIQRNKDKYTRALDVVPYVAAGLVNVPKNAVWLKDYVSEMAAFPEGAHDDQCLVAGTVVETDKGPVPIENISIGDKVLTRFGYRSVLWSGMTNENADVMTVRFSSGETITGTNGHPVFTESEGFVRLDGLIENKRGKECQRLCQNQWLMRSRSMESPSEGTHKPTRKITEGTTAQEAQISVMGSSLFTERYGSHITARYLTGIISTTLMATRLIMTSGTSLASVDRSIKKYMLERACGGNQMQSGGILTGLDLLLQRGTPAMMEEKATQKVRSRGGKTEITFHSSAASVIRNINHEWNSESGPMGRGRAASIVLPCLKDKREEIGKRSHARYAEPCSWEEAGSGHARAYAEEFSFHDQKEPVYNLTVEGHPEFYANGILVHNCDPTMDALIEMCGVGLYTLDNL